MTAETNIRTNEHAALVNAMCRMGEMLLDAGSETHRTEDTLSRIAEASLAVRSDIYVITASIVITLTFADGEQITSTRRITSTAGTDFQKLEALNELSREYCSSPFSADEFMTRLDAIEKQDDSAVLRLLGSMLAAGSFAMFFKGTWMDGAAAALFACMIWQLKRFSAGHRLNQVAFSINAAFLNGLLIVLICRLLPFLNADKIIIGDIMLLIPGIALTNAVRDILVGDTISGTMRLIESLMWAFALAAGYMAAIAIGGLL
ncbi:MAG: threonine/serine exporter family protein [Bulleidia sp.]|nr:threonine/serine exporter family protein [Bulleidia sp.]